MGRPKHYSAEIATRCQRLIESLSVQVESDEKLAREFRGPLRTTFLLAMATPMIVLPMERLYKPIVARWAGVADDTELDAAVEARVHDTFDGRRFGEACFFRPDHWSYVDARPIFPVAITWPEDAFDQLADSGAKAAAAQAPAKDVMECLRNALSHGGVAYLDKDGRQNEDATNMLGFASYPAFRRTGELRLLRISVDGFQEFLILWARWLSENGVETALSEEGPGWLAPAEVA